MDSSLYLTGLPDSLSLQEMLDYDIKTEMDVDDCFNLQLPPLTLDESLDSKWELLDPISNSGNGLLFSRMSAPYSPGSDMTMWFNAGGMSSSSGGLGNCSSLDLDPTSLMVNPSSVMPITALTSSASSSSNVVAAMAVKGSNNPTDPLMGAPTLTAPPPPRAVVANTPPPVLAPVTTHISTPTPTQSAPLTARAKITSSGLNIVCSGGQTTPIAIVRTSSFNANSTSRVTPSGSVTRVATTSSITRVSSSPAMARLANGGSITRITSPATSTVSRVIGPSSLARTLPTSTFAKADSNSGINGKTPATTVRVSKPPTAILPDVETKAYPKPAYSYSCLIALALKNSANGSLPVSEIYNFMCEHFPYFKTAPNGWKNSVRHNLSLNKCFEKIEKPTGNGSQRKGCLWAMNPAKAGKMDEEVQKWSRKDPAAIRRAMIWPEQLEMLERGDMKRELPSSSTLSSEEDDEEEEVEQSDEDDDDEGPGSVSPPREKLFTPPKKSAGVMQEVDPIGSDGMGEDDDEFVDISAIEQFGDQSLSDFDIDVNDGLYDDFGEDRVNVGINFNGSAKFQGNYICKSSAANMATAEALASYVCKPSSTSTAVRIRKVQPAILVNNQPKRPQ